MSFWLIMIPISQIRNQDTVLCPAIMSTIRAEWPGPDRPAQPCGNTICRFASLDLPLDFELIEHSCEHGYPLMLRKADLSAGSFRLQERDMTIPRLSIPGLLVVTLLTTTSTVFAEGKAAQGEKVFTKCQICHLVGEGAHKTVGPQLNGVIGRHAASTDFSYSGAMKSSGLVWDEPTFKSFIKNPRSKVPGTKMAFPGLTNQIDIDNVTAYLETFDVEGKQAH